MNNAVWTEMTFVRVLNELGALGFDTQTVFGVVTLTKKVELSTPAAIRTNHVDPEFTSVDLDVSGRRYSFRITAMPVSKRLMSSVHLPLRMEGYDN